MVFISVHSFDPERGIFLARFVETFLELFQNVWLEVFSPRLGAPDDMVLVLVGRMVEMLNPHGTSVARRRAPCKVPFIPAFQSPYVMGLLSGGVSW